MTRLLVLLAAAALSAPASAAIYKWVDENGTTVYSNKPPDDVKLIKNAKIVVKDDQATPEDEARAEAARQRQLEERVASLERQLAAAQQPPVQYAPPPVQYAPPPVAPVDYGYPGMYGYPGFYPGFFPGVVVVRPVRPFFVRPFPVRTFHSGATFRAGTGFHRRR
jgi:hypothetical protein